MLQHAYETGVRMPPFIFVVDILQKFAPVFGWGASSIASNLASIRSSPSFDCGEPTCSRMDDRLPATAIAELGLPVFKPIADHLDGVVADLHGLLKCELLIRISEPAEYPVAGKRRMNKGVTCDPREPVSSQMDSLFISSSAVRFGCDCGSSHIPSQPLPDRFRVAKLKSVSSRRAVVGDRVQEHARPC